jgi:hypothetical protein
MRLSGENNMTYEIYRAQFISTVTGQRRTEKYGEVIKTSDLGVTRKSLLSEMNKKSEGEAGDNTEGETYDRVLLVYSEKE